ncbi:MAG: hypothetical protein KatS3mg115_1624 [Candidatus Poribacteria bacterium]|nr:MAG: hypothetical protein KatS3mg115_1624 [Candidatus Poribacteria bacterium]
MKGTARAARLARLRLVLFVLLVLGAVVLGRAVGLGERLREAQGWIESLGPWGPVVFVLLYAGAVTFSAPASVLTVAAGAIFGSVKGVVLVSIASTTGAGLAFLLARYLARDAVASRFANRPHFQRLDRLTERYGALIVAITRLVPLFPFNLLNYGFGLTRIPFRTYLFWSWLCMLPGTALYVIGADAVVRALTEGRVPWVLVGALIATGGAVVLLVRSARRRLRAMDRELTEAEPKG